ncbi:MAG: DUF4274 domain-containing protein [Desulfobacterales bacterium]|nr:DUF4274 domain-containing protein [Desulfobacterales bacterium]MCP4163021.1 DUF4274 domain-containing protein [Deltaproteobacteria bacterium]
MKRNFYCMDGHSSKFWSIELIENRYEIEYGALGSNPRISQKEFKDDATARKNFEKQIQSKLNKYYDEGDEGEFDTPGKMHEAAKRYNWDNGFGSLRKIINNKSCDKGTALLLFWLGAPGYMYQYKDKSEVPSHALENYEFLIKLEELYTSGFYENANILFNPNWDRTTISSKGHAWTNEYEDTVLKREIPETMCMPSISDDEWEQMKKDGADFENTTNRLT